MLGNRSIVKILNEIREFILEVFCCSDDDRLFGSEFELLGSPQRVSHILPNRMSSYAFEAPSEEQEKMMMGFQSPYDPEKMIEMIDNISQFEAPMSDSVAFRKINQPTSDQSNHFTRNEFPGVHSKMQRENPPIISAFDPHLPIKVNEASKKKKKSQEESQESGVMMSLKGYRNKQEAVQRNRAMAPQDAKGTQKWEMSKIGRYQSNQESLNNQEEELRRRRQETHIISSNPKRRVFEPLERKEIEFGITKKYERKESSKEKEFWHGMEKIENKENIDHRNQAISPMSSNIQLFSSRFGPSNATHDNGRRVGPGNLMGNEFSSGRIF